MTSAPPVEDLDARLEPEVRARPAVDEEFSRNARTLIQGAQARLWEATATYARGSALTTVMVEDVGAPRTPTGRVARKASTAWQLVESVVIRMRSPLDDRAVFTFENGSCIDAWIAPRGVSGFISAGYSGGRAFLFGPWGADMAYVPAWRRELIKDARRHAKPQACPECGAAVLVGFDQLDDVDVIAVVDAEPLEGPYVLLTEVASYLSRRDVYSAIKAGNGVELHRRDDFSIGNRRSPVHLEHQCPTVRGAA